MSAESLGGWAGDSEDELDFADENLGPEGEDGPERSLASTKWQGRSTAALPSAASGPLSTAEQLKGLALAASKCSAPWVQCNKL